MARATDIQIKDVRFSFVQGLFELQTTQSGKKQWNVTLLIPKSATETLAALEANFVAACVANNWGDEAKVRDLIKKGLIKMPVLDGDGKQGLNKKTAEPHAGFPGHYFIRCTSGEAFRPALVNAQVLPITNKNELKSGDYGNAVIACFTWENAEQGKGATFGISALQKVRDGESLGGGGGVDPNAFFKAESVDGADAPAETKDGAGAAGMFG